MNIYIYQNYHKHTYDSNIMTPDSPTSIEDYAKRCNELGHKVLSSCEHGWQGRYYNVYDVAKKYSLKFIFGTEAYWVKNRFEKDKTNAHITIFAKNENGRRDINRILSDANIDGYYYKPRVDLELLLSLNPNNVFLTSACVGFWKYDDIEDIVFNLYKHFKTNFMLEVQYHLTELQKDINKKIIKISKKLNIDIIMGCDSHYIYPEQNIERDAILEAKHVRYEDEEGWFMDYPSGEIAFERFKEQGILSIKEIHKAMDNTNIFLKFEDIEFNKDIKLPTIYSHLTQQEKDMKFMEILLEEWNNISKDIPKELHQKYKEEFKPEIKTVINTKMTDYFLFDYALVKEAIKNGGMITPTGRGSGVSYYINTLLGFSKIDRISAKVHLYPERFMSETRILETKSLPDLDLNCGNPEVFVDAQEKILGVGHSYPMIAFGTLREKSSFKMYARAKNINFDVANKISKQIEEYEKAYKYASDEDKEFLDVYDYIGKEYHDVYKQSEIYKGVISDKKQHPCGYLLYQGNIKEEIGLIKCKSESTKKEVITTVIDGDIAERYKFLKNDLLKVDVVKFIYLIYKRIGIKMHTVNELEKITKDDKKTWNIYSNGLTLGVNQVERESTTKKIMNYKPRNITELTAFIAGIRPSFTSMYHIFESRRPFSYGIKSFDDIIQTDEMKDSFLLYQEQIMATLNYAGIPMDECYGIIKGVAKKKKTIVYEAKERFMNGFSKRIMENEGATENESIEMTDKVWKIIEDSAGYGFNASHAYSYAFDSLYCAYLKAHYPLEFYEVLLEEYSQKGNKDKVAKLKEEMQRGFNIKVGDIKFGKDNTGFKLDRENFSINQSILSLKYMNLKISNQLYKLSKNNKYKTFIDLLVDIVEKTCCDKTHMEILINIDYFSEFGNAKKLLEIYSQFKEGKGIKYDKKYKEKTKQKRLEQLYNLENEIENKDFTLSEKVKNQFEYLGYVNIKDKDMPEDFGIILEINQNHWGTRFIAIYRINDGTSELLKITKKVFEEKLLNQFDMIKTITIERKQKKRKIDGKFILLDEYEEILSQYAKVVFDE